MGQTPFSILRGAAFAGGSLKYCFLTSLLSLRVFPQLCTQIFLEHDLTQVKFWLKKFLAWLDSSQILTQWKLSWLDSSQVIDSKIPNLTWLESSQSSEFEWHSNEVSNCQIWAILSDFWYISAPKSKKICSRKYGYVPKFTIFSRQCYSSTNYSSKHSEAQ